MKKNSMEVFNFKKMEDVPAAFKDPRFKGGSSSLSAIINLFLQRGRKDLAVQLWEYSYAHWLQMRKLPAGASRAKTHFQWMDEAIKNHFEAKPQDLKTISCTKGCSGCCYQEVFITDDEAILLSKKIKEGMEIDYARLKKQAKIKDSDAWIPVPKEIRRCVFLGDDSLCRVYDERPLTCRRYFVTSDPKICEDIGADNVTYMVHAAEAFVSAALNLKPKSGAMAKMLVERLPETK